MLTSIRLSDVMLSCFKEALLEASRGGHVDAICSLIVTGGKHSLQLRDCISEALRFHFYEAAAMLLTCYGAKHDKRKLLKYLMGLEMTRVEEEQAFSELAHHDGMPRDALDKMRYIWSKPLYCLFSCQEYNSEVQKWFNTIEFFLAFLKFISFKCKVDFKLRYVHLY